VRFVHALVTENPVDSQQCCDIGWAVLVQHPVRRRDGDFDGWPLLPGRQEQPSRALLAHVLEGLGAGAIAALLGRAERTVRGWLAQARVFAVRHLQAFTAMLAGLGGQDLAPRIGERDPVAELVRVLRALAAAAARRWGDKGLPEWERINLICRGRFLSPSLPESFHHGLAFR
jgi:hypothetical protein